MIREDLRPTCGRAQVLPTSQPQGGGRKPALARGTVNWLPRPPGSLCVNLMDRTVSVPDCFSRCKTDTPAPAPAAPPPSPPGGHWEGARPVPLDRGGSRRPALAQCLEWGSHTRARSRAGFVQNPPLGVPEGRVGGERCARASRGEPPRWPAGPHALPPAQPAAPASAEKGEPQPRSRAVGGAAALPAPPLPSAGCAPPPPAPARPQVLRLRPPTRCAGMISPVRSAPGGGGAGTNPTSG